MGEPLDYIFIKFSIWFRMRIVKFLYNFLLSNNGFSFQSPVLSNLNNIMKRIQDKLPTEERSRKGQRRKSKTKRLSTNSTVNVSGRVIKLFMTVSMYGSSHFCARYYYILWPIYHQIEALAVLNPDRNNTQTIMDGMAATYALRCNMRRDGESITVIMEKFPQFQHYKGNVVSTANASNCLGR